MPSRVHAFVALFALAGCAPRVQINRAVTLLPPECSASDATLAEGFLDIGTNAANANRYDAALDVDAGEATDITYRSLEVFYSTDQDRGDDVQLAHVDGLPVNEEDVHKISIGGTSATKMVFAPIVTREDAVLLQTAPFVASAIGEGLTARIIANVRVEGTTSGGTAVASQLFPIPLELCAGCLINPPECGVDALGNPVQPVANDAQVCTIGDDVPNFVCPSP